jgi:hypothetical protein
MHGENGNAVRGFVTGVTISLLMWAVLIGMAWLVWRCLA